MSRPDCNCSVPFPKFGLLLTLVIGGLAMGYFLSHRSEDQSPPTAVKNLPEAQRFLLTSFDAKDQNEAPELRSDVSGRVYLVFASQTGEAERTLFLTQADGPGKSFSTPQIVTKSAIYKAVSQMKGKQMTHETKMGSHLVCEVEKVHLAWTEALPDLSGVRTVLATSTDHGNTFSPPQAVHSEKGTRTTYTAMSIGTEGTLAVSWLDNREKSQLPFAAIRPPGQSAFLPEKAVHLGQNGKGICPCCPTATLVGEDGTVYVAFRNIEDGHRDIFIGRAKPGQNEFDQLFPVMPPTWKFDGCPHDGPSMVILGDQLHIVWMDARSGTQKCYYGRASLSDLKFQTSELSNSSGTQGNAKIFADTWGMLHLVWEESIGKLPQTDGQHQHGPPQIGNGTGRAIFYCLSDGSGRFTPPKAILPRESAFQTRPTITGTSSGEVIVAWNELDESSKSIMVTRVRSGEK